MCRAPSNTICAVPTTYCSASAPDAKGQCECCSSRRTPPAVRLPLSRLRDGARVRVCPPVSSRSTNRRRCPWEPTAPHRCRPTSPRQPTQSLDDACSREVRRDGERLRAFVQYLPPSPHLLICGAGPDAEPVASAARTLGWRVSVVDHRPAYADARRFPGAAVILADAGALRSAVALDACHAAVVMSHHLMSDVAYLRELSSAGTPGYVGLLGPAARRSTDRAGAGCRGRRAATCDCAARSASTSVR